MLFYVVPSLGSIALEFCTSIATISRRGVKEKIYFSIDEGCATLQDIVTFLAKNAFTEACCL